ncbi:MAG: hypothetical protein ACKV2V_08305, partial [Blastocatellia bacterium]
VLDPAGKPAATAKVSASLGLEKGHQNGEWQFEIPATAAPKDGKVIFTALEETAALKGTAELALGETQQTEVSLRLAPANVENTGLVVGEAGHSAP